MEFVEFIDSQQHGPVEDFTQQRRIKRIPHEVWSKHHQKIVRLYQQERYSRQEIIEILRSEDDFHVS